MTVTDTGIETNGSCVMHEGPEWIRVKTAMDRFRVSRSTVNRWVQHGGMPKTWIAGIPYVDARWCERRQSQNRRVYAEPMGD